MFTHTHCRPDGTKKQAQHVHKESDSTLDATGTLGVFGFATCPPLPLPLLATEGLFGFFGPLTLLALQKAPLLRDLGDASEKFTGCPNLRVRLHPDFGSYPSRE